MHKLTALWTSIVLCAILIVSPYQASEDNGMAVETVTTDEAVTEAVSDITSETMADAAAETASGPEAGDNETFPESIAESEVQEDISGVTEDAQVLLETVEAEETAGMLDASGPYIVNFNVDNNSSTYIEYTENVTGRSGYINGYYGADAAYLGSSGNYYIFMMSGVVGKVSTSKVSLVAVSAAKSCSYYYVDSGTLYHRLTRNLSADTYISNLMNGYAPSYLAEGTKYYSYDGHYFYTDFATMVSDYMRDTRSNSVNPNSPYYNYYQFLPLRSEVFYSAADLNQAINSKLTSSSKMKDIGSALITNQNTYGVNALLMASIAANESAWGNSTICQEKNNLFGLGAVDATPGQSANYFSSVSACLKDFAETYMSKQYLNPNNWKYAGGYLGNKASGINVQYASDPYWGEKAADKAYNLDNSLSAKDSYRYVIGVKNTISCINQAPTNGLNIRNSSSGSATKLYSAPNLFSVAFLVKDGGTASNSFYKIQSDPVLNSGRTAIDSSSGVYNFSNMYAYVSASYVTIVSQARSGVLKAADGNWYYYENGVVKKDFTGIAKNENGWWRIENGKVNFGFKGFVENSYGWWYLSGGQVQFGTNDVIQGTVDGTNGWWYVSGGQVIFTNTVAKNSSGWWYIKNGKVDFSYTGLAKNSYGWWRIENGKVNFGFNGFAENSYGWWYLSGGQVQFGTNGVIRGTVNGINGWWYVSGGQVIFTNTVAKNSNGWWYIKNGMVDFSYTGLAKNSYGWWYIKNGLVDFSYTGLAKNSYGWWRIENGKVNFGFKGFAENSYGWWYLSGGQVQFGTNDVIQGTVDGTNGWWYVSGGQVVYTDTVAQNSSGWWYIKNGKVDFSYTGLAKNSYGWWRIENGKVDFGFKGFAENSYGWWYLSGGQVQFGTNDVIRGTVDGTNGWWYVSGGQVVYTDTVAQNSNGWWYIKNGLVDFSYTGLAKNSYGWWRIEDGKVNFDFEGFAENSYGWWYLSGGQVQFGTNDVIQGTVNGKNGWWYIKDGMADLSYNGVAKNSNGWWYIQGGMVDFSCNGTVQVDGVTYSVENGKVDMK